MQAKNPQGIAHGRVSGYHTPVTLPSPSSAPNALAPLVALTAEDIGHVNRLLEKHLHSHVPLIPVLGQHLLQAGGKRIRPMLLLACAHLCGYRGEHHHTLAAAVECIHTATLLHDDVVDESTRRRGRETANHRWGNKASVLVGDFLFSRAFTLMVEAGSLDILDVLARASNVIAEGEVLQLAAQGNASTTEEHYMAVIRAKTAALFAAATRIGGMLAALSPAHVTALENFGLHTGIAFQIADDVLDYIGAPDQSGKAVGNDLAQGKMTLPVILAFRQGDASEQAFWKQLVESPADSSSDAALHRALALLERHDTLKAALRTAESHAAKAADCLSSFPASAWKDALLGMLEFVVRRTV